LVTEAVHEKDGRIFLQLLACPALPASGAAAGRHAAGGGRGQQAGGRGLHRERGEGEPSLVWAFCSAFAGGFTVGGFGLGPPSRGSQELAMRDDRGHLYPRATPLQLADLVDLNWLRR
jgi:hypothetical protein